MDTHLKNLINSIFLVTFLYTYMIKHMNFIKEAFKIRLLKVVNVKLIHLCTFIIKKQNIKFN